MEPERVITDGETKLLQWLLEWSHPSGLPPMDVRILVRLALKMGARLLLALVGKATRCIYPLSLAMEKPRKSV